MNISDAPEVQAALDAVRTQLQAAMTAQQISGLSVGVVADQELIWTEGIGLANKERAIAAMPETMYRIASITKVFTTTMLLHARDAGLVRLDDAVTKYLPDYHIATRFHDCPPPTLRQLASHISGLPANIPGDDFNAQDFPKDTAEFLARLAQTELALLPGSFIRYSNAGIVLLGLALQAASGMRYEDYLLTNILRPLGMQDSGLYIRPIPENFAIGYVPDDFPMPVTPPDVDFAACSPEAQMYSTVCDMAKFVSLQFRDGDAPAGGAQIIAGSSLREMHNPVMLAPDWSRGMGLGFALFRLGDYAAIRATGGLVGYASNITILPALKLGVIVLANAFADAEGIAHAIATTLTTAFATAIDRAEEAIPTPAEWQQYIGYFAYPGHKGLDVTAQRGRLVITSRQSGNVYRYEGAGTHRFRGSERLTAGELIHFTVDDAGKVQTLVIGPETFSRMD